VVATWADGRVAAVEGLGDVRALGVQWHPDRRRLEQRAAALFEWLAREAAAVPADDVPAVSTTRA
jgi:gamma-glutamyl-gamma-aminobutyrate hydrolase PuuD